MRLLVSIASVVCLSLLALAIASAATANAAIRDKLLPLPKEIRQDSGAFRIPGRITICVLANASDRTLKTLRILESDLRSLTHKQVGSSKNMSKHGSIQLSVKSDNDPESYTLKVTPDYVEVIGGGEAGLFYGTRTLLQLLDGDQIPACEIKDNPDYKYRMVLYDIGREQTTDMPYLKKVIDRLSDHKVNMLHLYIENAFRFTSHPELGWPGVFTAETAKELDAYAAERFLEIVPEVNCLAHVEALAIEKYKPLAEGKGQTEICVLNPESVAFVQDMVREVAACFKSKYFHMGGDESSVMGSCPKCAERVKADGGKQKLFLEHYTKMAGYLRSLGKRPMMWGDMLLAHKGVAESLPKDIIIFDWNYWASSVDTVKYFTSLGLDTYVCPAIYGYARTAALYRNTVANIYDFLGQGVQGGAVGECTCSWECRAGQFFNDHYWGILLSADRAWNVEGCKVDDYNQRFCKAFFGVDNMKPIDYYKEIGDAYTKIYESAIPGSGWIAEGQPSSALVPGRTNYGAAITPQMIQASDVEFSKIMEMLRDLRGEISKNKDVLDFADISPRLTHMMIQNYSLFYQADTLMKEADKLKKDDPAGARDKLGRALALLKKIDSDVLYVKGRFESAAKQIGASPLDIVRMGNVHADIEAKIKAAGVQP